MANPVFIVTAGGSGARMHTDLPKQFLELAGRPVLMHTLERLHRAVPQANLIVVIPAEEHVRWQSLCEQHHFHVAHTVCSGGATRFQSVRKGLLQIDDASWIAVHDGVRPLVDSALIERGIRALNGFDAAIPVLSVTDSLRRTVGGVSRAVDRSEYCTVQTPQFFRAEILMRAYQQAESNRFTDDATVAESMGVEMTLFDGDSRNLKITHPIDLQRAELFMNLEL